MNTKFPPVKALKAILGLVEGTKLTFDYNLAKYVSRVVSEDIGEDEYYYSGSAIAIDPYIVKNNIGEFFEYVDEEIELEDRKIDPDDEKFEEEYYVHQPKEFKELDTDEWVEWTKGDLIMTCHNCGNIDVVEKDIKDGIQTVLPTDNHNEIRLVCPKCNSAMSLHFRKAEDGEVREYVEIEVAEEKGRDEPEE